MSDPDRLKLWMKMDAQLRRPPVGWGLNVPRFAKKCKVAERTVYRWLELFKEMGQRMSCVYSDPETREYVWRYDKGIEPLFTRNKLVSVT